MLPYAEFDNRVTTDLMSIVTSLNLGMGLKEGYELARFMFVIAKIEPAGVYVLLVKRGDTWKCGDFFVVGKNLEEARRKCGEDQIFIRGVTKQAGMKAVGMSAKKEGARRKRKTRRRRIHS